MLSFDYRDTINMLEELLVIDLSRKLRAAGKTNAH